MPGGIVGWKFYKKYKEEEAELLSTGVYGVTYDSFVKLVPKLCDSQIHQELIMSFYLLLGRLISNEKYNYMHGKKLIRLCGVWAFDFNKSSKSDSEFSEGISCWSVAAEANYHLFLAYLRTLYPDPRVESKTYLSRSLEKIIQSETTYPPPRNPFTSKPVAIPKVTLTVGRLSSNPFILLQRISKIIQFEDKSKFNTEDDFLTLFYLFNDVNNIEKAMSSESRRVLDSITKQNSIFTDHKLKIKDTPNLPYDLRCRTWSKSYNHAFVSPITGEPHRPLTNYVYEDHQRELLRKAKLPSGMQPALPYPDRESASTDHKQRNITIGSWDEVYYNYQKAIGKNMSIDIDKVKKDRKISADNLASCMVSTIGIDDYFIWLWMSTLSAEQDELRKALFGRSIVVEINLDNTLNGRRWIVVEEILHPKPAPMQLKNNPDDLPLKVPTKTKQVSKAKPKVSRQKVEKKPVRFDSNVTHVHAPPLESPKPVKAKEYMPPVVVEKIIEPKEQTIHITYDDLDPLVAAVAARLNLGNYSKQEEQEEQEEQETTRPKSISADEGNNKGVQTVSMTSVAVETEPYVEKIADIPSIEISPSLDSPEKFPEDKQPKIKRSQSYEDVINAIPFFADDTDDFDFSVTPIVDVSTPLFLPKQRVIHPSPPQSENGREPSPQRSLPDAESFVTAIDASNNGRRVMSTPVTRPRVPRSYEGPESYNPQMYPPQGPGNYNSPGLRPMSYRPPPKNGYPNPNAFAHQRSMSTGMNLPPQLQSVTASNRENSPRRSMPPLGQPRSYTVQDEELFDRLSNASSNSSNRLDIQNPMFRPPSPRSTESSASNLNAPLSYGKGEQFSRREKFGPYPPPPNRFSRDPRDPRDLRERPPMGNSENRSSNESFGRTPRDFNKGDVDQAFRGTRLLNDPQGKQPNKKSIGLAIPSIDDMMLDSGPMRGGAGRVNLKLGNSSSQHPFGSQNTKQTGSSNFDSRPSLPGAHHSNNSAGSIHDQNSDHHYRYDMEKYDASPGSGYASLPLKGSVRRRPPGSYGGSDSDVSNLGTNNYGLGAISNLASSGPRSSGPYSSPSMASYRDNEQISHVGLDNQRHEGRAIPPSNQSPYTTSDPVTPPNLKPQSGSNAYFNGRSAAPLKSASTAVKTVDHKNSVTSVSASFISKSTDSAESEDIIPKSAISHEFAPSAIGQPYSQDNPYGASSGHNFSTPSQGTPVMIDLNNTPPISSSDHTPKAEETPKDVAFRKPGSLLIDDTPIEKPTNWKEVKENLEAMKESNKAKKLPVVVESPVKDGKNAQTLVTGLASPEDFVPATVDTMRHPSLVTGDHVKTIVVHSSDLNLSFNNSHKISTDDEGILDNAPIPPASISSIAPPMTANSSGADTVTLENYRKSSGSNGGLQYKSPVQFRSSSNNSTPSLHEIIVNQDVPPISELNKNIGRRNSDSTNNSNGHHDPFEGFDYTNERSVERAMPILMKQLSNSEREDNGQLRPKKSRRKTTALIFSGSNDNNDHQYDGNIESLNNTPVSNRRVVSASATSSYDKAGVKRSSSNKIASVLLPPPMQTADGTKVSRFSLQGLMKAASTKRKK